MIYTINNDIFYIPIYTIKVFGKSSFLIFESSADNKKRIFGCCFLTSSTDDE